MNIPGDEHCLARAIKANAADLAKDMPFKDSELPDEVVKRGCITEDECKAIRDTDDRKTQVRAIILMIKNRSFETMVQFLNALKPHCMSIVNNIWQQYSKNMNENSNLIKIFSGF